MMSLVVLEQGLFHYVPLPLSGQLPETLVIFGV